MNTVDSSGCRGVPGAAVARSGGRSPQRRRAVWAWTLALLLALPATEVTAAFERRVTTAARDGRCGAGPAEVALDLLSPERQQDRVTVSATAGELYELSELRTAGLGIRARRGATVAALDVTSLGGAVLRERTLGIAVGRRFGDAGFALKVRGLGIDWPDGAAWTVSVDVHGAWLVGGRLVLGADIRNAGASSILSSPVSSPVLCGAALCLDGATLVGSVRGETGFAPSPALGLELDLVPWLRLRCGIRINPGSFAVGVGLGRPGPGGPALDLACAWHPVLGLSSSLTVSLAR